MVAIQLITDIIFQSPPVKCKFFEKDGFFRTFFLSAGKQEATQVPINERCEPGGLRRFQTDPWISGWSILEWKTAKELRSYSLPFFISAHIILPLLLNISLLFFFTLSSLRIHSSLEPSSISFIPNYVRECCVLSHAWLFVTPWTVALRAPLSMEFSRQEY